MLSLQRIFWQRGRTCRNSRFAKLALIVALSARACAQVGEHATVHLFWRTPFTKPTAPPTGIPTTSNGRLFIVTSQVEAYSLDTGRLLWQSPLHSYVPRNLVAGKGMVFVSESTVSALDEITGKKIWEFTPEANASLGRATVDGDTLYFGTANHHLYAVRASDGRELWMRDLGPDWKDPAVVRGITVWKHKIYATVEQWRSPNGRIASGWLIALKAGNGRVLWRYHTGEDDQRRGLSSAPAVTDKLVVSADYLSNAIIAVDRRKGQELWRFQGEPGFVGFPEAPVIEEGKVFIGSGDTFVYALDLNTGHPIWRTKLSAAVEAYALCGQSLLVNEQGFVTLDPRTGNVEETLYSAEAEFPSSGFAIVGKQAMVAGPKAVYAFVCR